MKDMLKGGLEWLCSEKRGKGTHVAKLEGRYIDSMSREQPLITSSQSQHG